MKSLAKIVSKPFAAAGGRRSMIAGFGLVMGLALVAVPAVPEHPAFAAASPDGAGPVETAKPAEGVQMAAGGFSIQIGPDYGGRRRPHRDWRDDDRGHVQRRYSRRELAGKCQYDRRFRRNNRSLCRRVTGDFGRRGTCVRFGNLTICE